MHHPLPPQNTVTVLDSRGDQLRFSVKLRGTRPRIFDDFAQLYVVGRRAVLLFAAINLLLRAVIRHRFDAQR
jgi:hypothetical protein